MSWKRIYANPKERSVGRTNNPRDQPHDLGLSLDRAPKTYAKFERQLTRWIAGLNISDTARQHSDNASSRDDLPNRYYNRADN